ncbi:hypothetical protein PBY51_001853 [Eleginops maclovinus]|uniref:Uncharacterized protein n=1 Tax=Eleginops maclovinus TaxID=56733 RepID=A0AAN7WRI4_ELEMC|nr:hypothetical protein PBY51_001853 [Eleginops maclovinus]
MHVGVSVSPCRHGAGEKERGTEESGLRGGEERGSVDSDWMKRNLMPLDQRTPMCNNYSNYCRRPCAAACLSS